METFTKLFSSITDSSIWAEDHETRIVWITLLAMADRHGYIGAAVPGLAARARVPVDAVRRALAKFLAPDHDSRSQEHEGRRIEIADRGWRLLNYERFRDMRDEEARREYERIRKRAQRSRLVPDMSRASGTVSPGPPLSAHAEAEAEAEGDPDPDHRPHSRPPGYRDQRAGEQDVAGTARALLGGRDP